MIPSNIEVLPEEQYDDMGKPDQLKASDDIAVECVTQDAVWGEITEDGPNYRNLGFSRAVVLQIKSQIGLGVLGLPATFGIVGMIPGIILIIVMAAIITWTNYTIGTFKRNHPHVYSVGDAAGVLLGRIGKEVIGVAYLLQMITGVGSTMLSVSIALNAMSQHAVCTVIFVMIAAVVIAMGASLQTLSKIGWLGWIGVVCIMSSVLTLSVAVGVTDRPAAAPQSGSFDKDVKMFGSPSFVSAMNAVNVILFAYAGTPNYLPLVSEMKDIHEYGKSVLLSQAFVTVIYLIISCVVYHFTGQYIASPALGSAGHLMKRVCYGIAFCGLIVGGLLNLHLLAKYIFVRILGDTIHISRNTFIHNITWYACIVSCAVIAFTIAEAIPVFSHLLSLTGALTCAILCIQLETAMWLYDNWKVPSRTMLWKLKVAINVIMNLMGWFIMGVGTYAAVIEIKNGGSNKPFSCSDNSG
ncbi:hypothetical protein CNBG_10000 [Cryptococcus deuterogattii R265]|uniref:uncharacterized protein n=1 Tax=Cryptococcus deuterogattii (strain R265) TaxID=294750 RepID=UPI0019384941|nr:hypothetical protein CNBG_10000 [Cryptococcus deuterogattii R265]